LFDHNLKILLHINPELDCSSAAIKLATASREDNSDDSVSLLFILSGVESQTRTRQSLYVIHAARLGDSAFHWIVRTS
jgi:hypothetical protein